MQIGVIGNIDSHTLPLFILRLNVDHPSHVRKAVAATDKFTIPDTDCLSNSCFKNRILRELNKSDVEFVVPSANDGKY